MMMKYKTIDLMFIMGIETIYFMFNAEYANVQIVYGVVVRDY